ncbi:hypothetical protein Nmel_013198 [Mimus melanotis]
MSIPNAVDEPGGCVANLVDQRVPKAILSLLEGLRNVDKSIHSKKKSSESSMKSSKLEKKKRQIVWNKGRSKQKNRAVSLPY